MLNTWLGQAGLSHDQVDLITNWALRESGKLSSSQMSHLRNARIKSPSPMIMEGLAALNSVIWRWQTQGSEACIALFGPYSTHNIQPEWLDHATWLPHPDHPDEPLCFGDFAELFVGYLELPSIGVKLSVADGPELSRALAALLEDHWRQAGWGPTEGMGKILAAYPCDDADRRNRLTLVALGQADYSSEEFEDELNDLAGMIEALRDLPAGSYGAADLHTELTSGRRRS